MAEQKTEKRQFRVILLIVFLGFLGISMPYLIFPALFLNPAYSIKLILMIAAGMTLVVMAYYARRRR